MARDRKVEAVTTYWVDNKPVVVREWEDRKVAESYVRTMKRAKKKVTIQHWNAA